MTNPSPDSSQHAQHTELTQHYDHIVVGAGIVGLSTAFKLVDLGADPSIVAVIDPAPVSGASFVAGGMLAPVAEVQYKQEPLYPLMVASKNLYDDLLQRLGEKTNLSTGHRTESTFVVGADRADARHLNELTEHQHGHGMEVQRRPLRQARKAEWGLSPQLSGVVEIPGDHQVNPRMYCAALLDALRNMGVAILRERVDSIEDGTVTTDAATYTADMVYLCNGLGAGQVKGWYEGEKSPLKLRPVRGDMLRLRVPEEMEPPVGRVIRGFVEDRPVYIIPRTDGTIAVGATSREDARRGPAVDGVYTLLRDAIRIVPGIQECEFIEAITGERPGTPDDLPYLGKIGEKLVISTGYFRHGILLSALGATVGAALGMGQPVPTLEPEIDLASCAPLRHA